MPAPAASVPVSLTRRPSSRATLNTSTLDRDARTLKSLHTNLGWKTSTSPDCNSASLSVFISSHRMYSHLTGVISSKTSQSSNRHCVPPSSRGRPVARPFPRPSATGRPLARPFIARYSMDSAELGRSKNLAKASSIIARTLVPSP